MGRIVTWYRGFDSKYGLRSEYSPHLLWLTEDIEYAKEYGDSVAAFEIDINKCNGSIYDLDEGTDYYDGPSEEEAKELLEQGINSYCFYANDDSSYCMCLWDETPIVSQRILDNNELNESKNMKKNVIKLNESQLKDVIAKAVKNVIKEDMNHIDAAQQFIDNEEYAKHFLKWVFDGKGSRTGIMQDIWGYYDAKVHHNESNAQWYFDEVLRIYADGIGREESELNVPAIKKAINYWGAYYYTEDTDETEIQENKKSVKINESTLRKIVAESVKKALNNVLKEEISEVDDSNGYYQVLDFLHDIRGTEQGARILSTIYDDGYATGDRARQELRSIFPSVEESSIEAAIDEFRRQMEAEYSKDSLMAERKRARKKRISESRLNKAVSESIKKALNGV